MRVAIIGCGGHARSVADVLIDNGYVRLSFFDKMAVSNEIIMGGYAVRSLDELDIREFDKYVIAIGDNEKRCKIAKKYKEYKKNMSVISKRSYVGHDVKLGEGVFVGHGSYIGPEASIGDGCIINTNAIVEHQSEVNDFSHISVNSTICGKSRIGKGVFLGAGATIIDKISVCDNTVIGAGAVVVSDILDSGIYGGIPASRIK